MVSFTKRHSAPPTIKPKVKQPFVRVLKIFNNFMLHVQSYCNQKGRVTNFTWRHHLEKLFKVINRRESWCCSSPRYCLSLLAEMLFKVVATLRYKLNQKIPFFLHNVHQSCCKTYIIRKCIKQTRCSRGCFTNTFVTD